jgi:hypothetical protein
MGKSYWSGSRSLGKVKANNCVFIILRIKIVNELKNDPDDYRKFCCSKYTSPALPKAVSTLPIYIIICFLFSSSSIR